MRVVVVERAEGTMECAGTDDLMRILTRLPMVPVDSSAASIPRGAADNWFAVAISSA